MNAAARLTPPIVGVFFAVATAIAAASAITILFPGGPLDAIWGMKPDAYRQLLAVGLPAGIGFAALALVCALASIGSLLRRRWGWLLAASVIGLNLFADVATMLMDFSLDKLAGPVIAGLVLWWLTRRAVRQLFD